jgi:hypothetical protein
MSNPKLPRKGGPKTAAGKKRSCRNARRHGLFADEFSFSTADEVKFNKLNSDLHDELKPNNALLDLISQDVVACAWRMRIALRNEQNELQKQYAIENEESPEKPHGVGVSFPYPLKAGKREQMINLLNELQAIVERDRTLPPEFEKSLTQAFGPGLWKTLSEWKTLDNVGIWVSRLNEIIVARSQVFGMELPIADVSLQEKKKYFAADGLKEQEMMCKIIDIWKENLITPPFPVERGGGLLLDDRVSRLDLAIRYHTTARRDFYRSLREYREVKNQS